MASRDGGRVLVFLLAGATGLGAVFGWAGALVVEVITHAVLVLLAREDPPPPPEAATLALPEAGDDKPLRPALIAPRRMPLGEVLSRSAHWQRAAAFAMLCSAYTAFWSLGFYMFVEDPPGQALWDSVVTHVLSIPACGAVALWLLRAQRLRRS